MQITCNGEQLSIDDAATLLDLLLKFKLAPDTVVAEINRTIIARDQYESTRLAQGDLVELIRFVGGG
jgi:sulfur carrier protein